MDYLLMRYAKDHKTETHARIVKRASMQLREKGTRGIGVAELMKQAGLTHGGFYAHFGSREDLVAEAITHAMDQATQRWSTLIRDKPADQRFAILIDNYLSVQHRDDPGSGCAVASLAVDIAREDQKTRKLFVKKIEELIATFVAQAPEKSRTAARRSVISALTVLVGTIVLARVAGNSVFSTEILEAGKLTALGTRRTVKVRAMSPSQNRPTRKREASKSTRKKSKTSRPA